MERRHRFANMSSSSQNFVYISWYRMNKPRKLWVYLISAYLKSKNKWEFEVPMGLWGINHIPNHFRCNYYQEKCTCNFARKATAVI